LLLLMNCYPRQMLLFSLYLKS